MFLEPFVSVVIVANAILTGFQTDPQYRSLRNQFRSPCMASDRDQDFSVSPAINYCRAAPDRTWPGWIYVEMSFATVLMFETWLFILHCLIIKTWFKCSLDLRFYDLRWFQGFRLCFVFGSRAPPWRSSGWCLKGGNHQPKP